MMLNRLSIGTKILIAFSAVALIAVGVAGLLSFQMAQRSLAADAFNQLTSVREMKASQIEDYFQLIEDQVVTLSEDRMVVDAMRGLAQAYRDLPAELDVTEAERGAIDDLLRDYYKNEFLPRLVPNLLRDAPLSFYFPESLNARLLQHLYLSGNPYDTGTKHLLDDAGKGTTYSEIHAEVHPVIRDYLERFGYYDIFLVDPDTGEIIYTVFKEVDVGTSLLTGPYSDTAFGEAFRAARDATDPDFVKLVDFEPYHPSYNAPAAFIASPIFDGDEKVGVLLFQMPIDRINDIMTSGQNWADVGLGASGETYLVGEDYKLRNQSRFLIEDSDNYFKAIEDAGLPLSTIARIRNFNSSIGLQEVRTSGTEAALAGEEDTQIFPDYRQVPVLSSYRPLQIPGLNWVIMSEIDEAEAFAPIGELAKRVGLTVVGLMAFVFVAAVAFSRTITRPLLRLSENSTALADGDLDVEIDTSRGDEIGVLARDFDHMRESLRTVIGDLAELNRTLEQRVADRTAELEASERQTQAIVQSAGDAIIVSDADRRILVWNQAAESIFGVSAQDAVGRDNAFIMPESDRAQHIDAYQRAVEAGSLSNPNMTYELTGFRPDGGEFPIEMSLASWSIGGAIYFSAVIRDVTERKEMERRLAKANERMMQELNFARDIQMGMLPLIFPAFPDRTEVVLHAVLEPAREVGGDFYDFYFLDDDQLCVVVADVSGKGAPGALFMAVSKTLIKSRAGDDSDPASILTHVNSELSENNTTSTFVTVFLAVIDVRTGEMTYCNAGHNPPYIKRADGSLEQLDALHGPILGVLPGLTYTEDRVKLAADDLLFMFTDGVTESMNEADEEYTDQRLAKLLEAAESSDPEALVKTVLADVRLHEGEAEQADDITVLALAHTGAVLADRQRLTLRIRNELAELARVEERFHEFAEQQGISDTHRQTLSMVLDELLNNVVSYAYPDGGEHEIVIDVEVTGMRLVLTIEDDGIPFNPFGREEPRTDAALDERGIGGLGIHLVRNTMDEYLYQRPVNKNVVTLVKMLDR